MSKVEFPPRSIDHSMSEANRLGVLKEFNEAYRRLCKSNTIDTALRKAYQEVLAPAVLAERERLVEEELARKSESVKEKNSPASSSLPRFLRPDAFKGETASAKEIVEWVAANLAIESPKAGECPCPAAWAMLLDFRENADSRREFWQGMFKGLMPTRAQVEQMSGMVDDGGEVLRTLEMVERVSRSFLKEDRDETVGVSVEGDE